MLTLTITLTFAVTMAKADLGYIMDLGCSGLTPFFSPHMKLEAV